MRNKPSGCGLLKTQWMSAMQSRVTRMVDEVWDLAYEYGRYSAEYDSYKYHGEIIGKLTNSTQDLVDETRYWSCVRQDILDRDEHRCQLCGKKATSSLHIHHILKRRLGGDDYYDNLITVCPKCHIEADRTQYNPDWKDEG